MDGMFILEDVPAVNPLDQFVTVRDVAKHLNKNMQSVSARGQMRSRTQRHFLVAGIKPGHRFTLPQPSPAASGWPVRAGRFYIGA